MYNILKIHFSPSRSQPSHCAFYSSFFLH